MKGLGILQEAGPCRGATVGQGVVVEVEVSKVEGDVVEVEGAGEDNQTGTLL